MTKHVFLILFLVFAFFNLHAQDTKLDNYIRKHGYVKLTNEPKLPAIVKANLAIINKFFLKEKLDKSKFYVISVSLKDNQFLKIFIRDIDGLKMSQQYENKPFVGGFPGSGTLSIDLKSKSILFIGEQ